MSDQENKLLQILDNQDNGHAPTDPWSDTPLSLGHRPDPIPVDALGDTLGPFVQATSTSLQVPTDLVVNLALPTITTAIAGRRLVRVTPDWTEVLSVSTLTAANSGERKSPAQAVVVAALRAFQAEAQEEARPRFAEDSARRKMAEDRAEVLRKTAVKTGDPADEHDYVEACKKLANIEVTPLPRYIVDDATPEALVKVLAAHQAVGIISDEPGIFATLGGRYNSGQPNVEVVLKATSGSPITVDRAGWAEPVHIEHPALSIAACIQPRRLGELGDAPVFRNSGLLARLLYALPAPAVGSREITPPPLPTQILNTWTLKLGALAASRLTNELNLSETALKALNEFRRELEPMLHPDHGSLAGIADWGSKLPGAIVRIAGALTLLDAAGAPRITERVMADAIRIGRAYTSHAEAAFGVVHARSDGPIRGREVLGWLRAQIVETGRQNRHNPGSVDSVDASGVFTLRSVQRGIEKRSWVESAEDVRNALGVLVERGHVRKLKKASGGPGRPSERYQLHPDHLAEPGHPDPDPAAPTPTTRTTGSALPVWDD